MDSNPLNKRRFEIVSFYLPVAVTCTVLVAYPCPSCRSYSDCVHPSEPFAVDVVATVDVVALLRVAVAAVDSFGSSLDDHPSNSWP